MPNLLQKEIRSRVKKKDSYPSPTFPELKSAEENIRKIPLRGGTRRVLETGREAQDSFGEQLKNPKFKKEFRVLQEKYKITGIA